ncbi:helix-turn-helix domain-containing protein [Nocardia jiangxiensis]|uniref:Helix-turn-helix domain-containing protein n=1 Tax=Nocardia jiangxiensis TaxID=282685 RepID=A0ABW6RV81_9NOCA
MGEFGRYVEAARTRVGIDQAELAARVNVKQQTVSRWERGAALPKETTIANLATALGVPAAELARLREQDMHFGDNTSGALPSKGPLASTLPYGNLYPDQFELFVTDLYKCTYPDAEVERLGGQGDDQQGYDILVTHTDGWRVGVQCKREREFGPQKVHDAVDEAELEVDESEIALSRRATNAARSAMRTHPGWVLRDQDGLSQMVRLLPHETSIRLVDRHFPHCRESFLGERLPTPWLTTDEFFQPRAYSLLDHRRQLVGRKQLLDEIIEWCAEESTITPLAVVIGRGGIGKSKLLYEVATRARDTAEFRFLDQGQKPDPSSFDVLPFDRDIVVVIDDAHTVESFVPIAAQLRTQRPRAKLLLATRPDSGHQLEDQIAELNIASRSLRRWTVTDLDMEDAIALASDLLGRPDSDLTVRQLAAISADCPFIATVGADLLNCGTLAGHTFQTSQELRSEVSRQLLLRTTIIGSSSNPERKKVLEALAAYQPVRLDDPSFQNAMIRLTQIASWDHISARIHELEDSGLIIRRGKAIRVVPDMLADITLINAAFDERAQLATEFLERAHRAAEDAAVANLLINASRADWQIRDGDHTVAGLVDALWDTFRQRILAADYEGQMISLRLLERVAYYQPHRALPIVEHVLESGPVDLPSEEPSSWYSTTRSDIIRQVPAILQRCAYTGDLLMPVLDTLWSMAQKDSRPTGPNPNHPLRIIQNISSFRLGKPYEYMSSVIDVTARWFATPHPWWISPFDAIEPMLATEGTDEFFTGVSFTLSSFSMSPDSLREIRAKIIRLATGEARNPDIIRAVQAIRALGKAITLPPGRYGRSPDSDETQAWSAEFLPVIAELGAVGAEPHCDPLVRTAVGEALAWHAAYSPTETKAAAQAAQARFSKDEDDDLVSCLHRGHENPRDHLRDGAVDLESMRQALEEKFDRAADTLTRTRTPSEALRHLEKRLALERRVAEKTVQGRQFLHYLFRTHTDLATELCLCSTSPELPELRCFLGQAVTGLIDAAHPRSIEIARSLLDLPDIRVQRSVVEGMSQAGYPRESLLDGELDLLTELARNADEAVRGFVACAAVSLSLWEPFRPAGLGLLAALDFRGSGHTAREALRLFASDNVPGWADTSVEFRDKVLNELVECDNIDEYEITSALSTLSCIDPLGVTQLFIYRSAREGIAEDIAYRALPTRWVEPLRIRSTSDLEQCLIKIRDWMIDEAKKNAPSDDGNLYVFISGEWSEQAIAIATCFDAENQEAAVAVAARLISRMPVEVQLDNVAAVRRVFDWSAALGNEVLGNVATIMSKSPIVVERASLDGSPRPELVGRRDRAQTIAGELPYGSPVRAFYQQIADDAKSRIARETSLAIEDTSNKDW